jgi:ABC-type transporter Mla subunit MlaD
VIRRIVTAGVLVLAVVAAVVLGGAGGEATKGTQFKIAFDNAFGLTKGGDLRVGGVIAGKTSDFKLSKGPECQNTNVGGPPRTCAIVEAEITEPGFRSFRTDTRCAIRQQSLIGEYYVDCQPGKNKKELKSGAKIPVTHNQSTIPTDLVNNVLRRPYRERLRLIIAELGTGLAGRPDDLAEVLKRAHPGLRETQKTLKILGDQADIIKNFIKDSDTVVAALDERKQDVARWIKETGETAEISASRADAISAGFHRLPRFLDELRPTMVRLGELADAQTPLLRDLQRAAPSLTEFFTRLGPFADASRPAFRSLGRTADVGSRAFRHSAEEIEELRQVAKSAPGLAKPLRQLLQTADDPKRHVDNDPRAAHTAPPSPDLNSNARQGGKRRGFTAMESLLNYIFWQTLAINEFDSLSHLLRVAAYSVPECSQIQNDLRGPEMNHDPGQHEHAVEQEQIRKKCNSYLGPFQPGITSPDPTDPDGGFRSGTQAKSGAKIRPTKASKLGERRGAGQPRALPLPGQVDPSKPQVVLPPGVQELVERLQRGLPPPKDAKLPNLPGLPRGAAPDQMLDFLLSP